MNSHYNNYTTTTESENSSSAQCSPLITTPTTTSGEEDILTSSSKKEIKYVPPRTKGLDTSASAPALRLVPVPRYKTRQNINFKVLGPIAVTMEEDNLTNPGCSVIDLIFPRPSQIGELVFRNFYTAWITILAHFHPDTIVEFTTNTPDAPWYGPVNRVVGPLPGGAKPLAPVPTENKALSENLDICMWNIVIPRKVLMPRPHYELGSHDFVSIPATESLVVLKNTQALRLILHQPSPIWQTFYVEELNVYSDIGCNAPPQIPHSHSITDPVYCNKYDPLLALVRYQTMGAIYKNKFTVNSNAPDNLEPPTYQFFSLPEV